MRSHGFRLKEIAIILIVSILWAVILTAIYAPSPLYTSNQNQYFLHGLANAGYGILDEDWLTNTIDPTPLFSLLVEYTFRLTGTELVFYLYYLLIFGIYFTSIFGIADLLFHLRDSKTKTIAFIAVFMLLHSAALHFILTLVFGTNDLIEGGLAGQRILGSVFQPSSFGVLLILSIYLGLKDRYYLATLVAALAAVFHPTYLLSAAVLTAVYMWLAWQEQHSVVKSVSIGVLALLTVAPILIYVYTLYAATPAETTARARDILVNFRIPHHAIISEWWGGNVIVKVAIVLIAMYLVRSTKLASILLACFSVAVILTLLQLVLQNDALALIFPWRISAFLVPLSTSLIAAYLVSGSIEWLNRKSPYTENVVTILSMILMAVLLAIGITRFYLDLERKQHSDESGLMTFVAQTKTRGDSYLIPTKMQDFRLTTGAPTYVDFKSIPYQDNDVLEWYRRQRLAGKFYRTQDCQLLTELAETDGITHVVLPSGDEADACPNLNAVYQDSNYGVYRITRP